MYHLTTVSSNSKTGPIPVSTSTAATCPDSCPLKKAGCYADVGPLGMHWKAVTEGKRGSSWDDFLAAIRKLPHGILWRHNQAGDLPGNNEEIDAGMLAELVRANGNRKGFTYTHKPMNAANAHAVAEANRKGFTINLSANSPAHADQLAALGIGPVVSIVREDAAKVSYTPEGRKMVVCPAQTSDRVTCASCGLCQRVDREYIIGFRAHGASKKKAQASL